MKCLCCEDKKFQIRADGIKIPCPGCNGCDCKPCFIPIDIKRKLRLRDDDRYEVKIWFADNTGIYGGYRFKNHFPCHLDHWILCAWQLNGLAAKKAMKVSGRDLIYAEEEKKK